MDDTLLIAGMSDPVVSDYAARVARSRNQRAIVLAHPEVCGEIKECVELHSSEGFSKTAYRAAHSQDQLRRMVIFLDRKMTSRDQEFLDTVTDLARDKGVSCICIVSSFRVHLGDPHAIRSEDYLVNRLKGLPARIVILRPANILSPRSRLTKGLRKYCFLAPLVPSRFTTCCVEAEELFAAIDQELEKCNLRKGRTYTLLGANTPWKNLLAGKKSDHPPRRFAHAIVAIFRLLLIGQVVGLFVDFLVKWFPNLRAYIIDVLYPTSVQELLALYSKYNYRNVKIVGYNNGIIHFGHSYPGKTVVSTIRCNRSARVQGSLARFDGGATVRQATEVLKKAGKELYVIPNYSFVSMGTSYFIPIHGSASGYSTIGETIEKALLFDPAKERFIVATRKSAEFREYMYNLTAEVLLLRLTVRVREKTQYSVKVLKLENPSGSEILNYFHDKKPSNVEVRKGSASSEAVKVSLYYSERESADTEALELPRDTLGSLWDRLESNRITSVLFHGMVRRLAHHVELFLSEKDFAIFWDTHRAVPLSKIQLRYIKCDGMPHSPFQHHDCISVDLFMLKKHKYTFEAYLKSTLPSAAMNPGKHSR